VYLLQESLQERKHEEKRGKEVKKLSEKLNYQIFRSMEVSTGNKRIEYLPEENIIIKKSGSVADPLDIAEDLFR
jgi:hypothetical protein